MNYFRIENAGEILPEAFTLLGASSKEDDDSKIGFFGSGNKYAIACFLRNNIGLKVFSGDTEITFTTVARDFRGEHFEQIAVNGEMTSLTTRTGPAWDVWMAIREMISNAIDEGGYSWQIVDTIEPKEGVTRIFITMTDAVCTVVNAMHSMLSTGREILDESDDGTVKILSGTNTIYRKGIRCVPWNNSRETLFDYDIDSLDLNETRLFNYDFQVTDAMQRALSSSNNQDVIRAILELHYTKKTCWEADMSWRSYWSFSDTWKDVLASIEKQLISSSIASFLERGSITDYFVIPSDLYTLLKEAFPDLPWYGQSTYLEVKPSKEFKGIIRDAVQTLKKIGVTFKQDIVFAKFTTERTAAIYDKVRDVIVVSDVELPTGDTWATVLLEEVTHATTGYGDVTRQLQDYLFRKWLEAEQKAAQSTAALAEIRKLVRSIA